MWPSLSTTKFWPSRWVPIVEEICLHGVVVPLLARLLGSTAAVLVTSAVFAFSHWPASLLKLTSIRRDGNYNPI